MRTALLISAMLGLTAATPRPQNELDWTENRGMSRGKCLIATQLMLLREKNNQRLLDPRLML